MRAPRLFAVVFWLATIALFPMSSAYAEQTGQITVICAKADGTTKQFGVGWDNSNQFFQDKGNIAALFCQIGSGGWETFVSTTAPASTLYYNGVIPEPTPAPAPAPEPSPTPTPSEPTPEPSPVNTPESIPSPTPSPDTTTVEPTPPAPQPSPVPSTSPLPDPEPSASAQPSPDPAQSPQPPVDPIPQLPASPVPQDPVSEQPAPAPVETPSEPAPQPPAQPIQEPPAPPSVEPDPTPAPVPSAEQLAAIEAARVEAARVIEEARIAEEKRVEEEKAKVEAEITAALDAIVKELGGMPDLTVVEPPVVISDPEPIEVTPLPTPEPPTPDPAPVPEPIQPTEPAPVSEPVTPPVTPPVSAPADPEPVQLTASTDLEALPPDTPVELENGVVLTAEVVIALQLLENPADLIGAIFADPSQALAAIGNIGADMSPEVREKAEKVVISAIIAGNIATTTAVSAAIAYRREP